MLEVSHVPDLGSVCLGDIRIQYNAGESLHIPVTMNTVYIYTQRGIAIGREREQVKVEADSTCLNRTERSLLSPVSIMYVRAVASQHVELLCTFVEGMTAEGSAVWGQETT